jgi:hypothetical protein
MSTEQIDPYEERRVVLADEVPFDFKFEIHLNEKGCPYTSRIACHSFEKIANKLKAVFCAQYDFDERNVYVMSSYEQGQMWVWVRANQPITKKLEGKKTLLAAPNFVDVEISEPGLEDVIVLFLKQVNEDNNKRLSDNLRLKPPPDSSPIIDI